MASLAIAGTLPVMAFAAGLIYAALGRPILFAQSRAGLGGVPFTIVKFRTMSDLRDSDGTLLGDEHRRTQLGDLLRRLRLDELPQLFAVRSGAMDFVGPRPLLPATIEGYGALGEVRGRVRPGLTGWAQVSGNARLSDNDKLALDIWYVDHRKPLLDLRILLETVGVVLLGERVRHDRIAAARDHLARREGPFR